ncbi:hypothetical protein KEM56_004911, partial [Ascosphaera pollenicola]
ASPASKAGYYCQLLEPRCRADSSWNPVSSSSRPHSPNTPPRSPFSSSPTPCSSSCPSPTATAC